MLDYFFVLKVPAEVEYLLILLLAGFEARGLRLEAHRIQISKCRMEALTVKEDRSLTFVHNIFWIADILHEFRIQSLYLKPRPNEQVYHHRVLESSANCFFQI